MGRDMGNMGVSMGRHGKAIVGTGGLRVYRNWLMGKMGEMGKILWKSVGSLCLDRDVLKKARTEAMLYGRQILVQEG